MNKHGLMCYTGIYCRAISMYSLLVNPTTLGSCLECFFFLWVRLFSFLCCVFVLFVFILCRVSNVANVSGLSILDCPFSFFFVIFFISYYPYPVITKCSEAMKTFKGAPHRFYPFISRCKEAIKAQMDVSYYLYLVRNTTANYMKSHDFILFTFIHL